MSGPALREVCGIRYVLPLREGGSLPGLVEADDLGTYVVKFRGAGQGTKALVAEVVVGEVARALGLPVPELVVVWMDAGMAAAEPDEEVQDLLRASHGRNLGVDFLPGSIGLELPADAVRAVLSPDLAAEVVWLDAWLMNVDRSWRNPNLLVWHGRPWLIDHGAALYFHHDWATAAGVADRPTPTMAEHVLLRVAGDLWAAHERLAARVDAVLLATSTAAVPDEWLPPDPVVPTPDHARAAYRDLLLNRLAVPEAWLDPVEVLRAARV
jgi:hypothetical protein